VLVSKIGSFVTPLRGMRNQVGSDFLILIKLNSEDIIDGGLTVNDSLQAVYSGTGPGGEPGLVARWASGDLAKATCPVGQPVSWPTIGRRRNILRRGEGE
jgi:hypothetical protein